MSRPDPLVAAAEFGNVLEAHSVRILLEANGIPAVVVGDAAIGETGLVPIVVYVHKQNLQLAQTVIQEVPSAAEVLIPEWICVCGAEVDAGFQVCWSCGQLIESLLDQPGLDESGES